MEHAMQAADDGPCQNDGVDPLRASLDCRPMVKILLIAVGLAVSVMAQPAWSQGPLPVNETKVIPDIENRPITFHIERFDLATKVSILLVIDGSGCRGALRSGFASLFRPQYGKLAGYAKLTLTKPGIDPHATDAKNCSDEYRERYSIDSAVTDHLRVLQHLKARADWWDGKLYVYGWSDGGDIGARLISYYPNVERALLGAQGGGYTMAQHVEDFWDCAVDRNSAEQRQTCLAEMRGWFQQLREKPVSSLGKGESNKLWRSRIFADLAPILTDSTTPLLVMHGAKDRDNTPVESARLLITRLREAGRENLTYCEIPFMAHHGGDFTKDQYILFSRAKLHWLFDQPDAQDLLDQFCDPDPPLDKVAPPTAATAKAPAGSLRQGL